MRTAKMQDPKQVLDQVIDEAFAREQIVAAPVTQRPGRIIGLGLAASTVIAAGATAVIAFVARRRMPAQPFFVLPRYTRHLGFRRYRLGGLGTAYIAYWYKVPRLQFALPRPSLKLPVKSR